MMKHRVTSLTTSRVRAGFQLAVSLHRRKAANGETGTIKTCVMPSRAKMHMAGSKTGVRSVSGMNRSNVKRGTMTTMVPITTNLTKSILPKEGAMQEQSRPFPMT
jgi:hypothetical protein